MGLNQTVRAQRLSSRIGAGAVSFGLLGAPLLAALLVGLCSALALRLVSGFSEENARLCGCLFAFGAIQALIAFKLFRQDPSMIWTPMPWFLLTCAMYYGLGPLMEFFDAEA